MILTKFEQSGFILETNAGFKMAFDIGNKTPVEKLEGITVDLMVISHIHGDHFHPINISKLQPQTLILTKECKNVLKPNSLDLPVGASLTHQVIHSEIKTHYIISRDGFIFENDQVSISFFNVDHGPNISAPVENLGFIITADNQTIYFAGDMFYESGIDVTSLEVDYALIPVGTFYTFGPEEALAFARKFKKIGKIISMHYENKPETHPEFLKLVGEDFDVE